MNSTREIHNQEFLELYHPLSNYLSYEVDVESPIDQWEMQILFSIFDRISLSKYQGIPINLAILPQIEKYLLTKLHYRQHKMTDFTKVFTNEIYKSTTDNIVMQEINPNKSLQNTVNWTDLGDKKYWYQYSLIPKVENIQPKIKISIKDHQKDLGTKSFPIMERTPTQIDSLIKPAAKSDQTIKYNKNTKSS